MLTGWDIDILTEAEESERRAEEFRTRSGLFIEALDVDEVIAHLLVAEGFRSVEEIAETSIRELGQIQGFDEDVATELRNRAQSWLDAQKQKLVDRQAELGIASDLMELEGVRPEWIVKLGESGIKTRDDLADLAGDELVEILGPGAIETTVANEIILKARAHWFAQEDQAS